MPDRFLRNGYVYTSACEEAAFDMGLEWGRLMPFLTNTNDWYDGEYVRDVARRLFRAAAVLLDHTKEWAPPERVYGHTTPETAPQ
jgi:hypothetical protein